MQVNLYFFVMVAIIVILITILMGVLKGTGIRAKKETLTALIVLLVSTIFFCISLVIKEHPAKFVFYEFKFIGLIYFPVCALFLYVKFIGAGDSLSKNNRRALLVIPTISTVLLLTNPFHHLFRKSMYITTILNTNHVGVENGPWFWINAAYGSAIFLISLLIFILDYYKRPKMYRAQIGIFMLAATLLLSILIMTVIELTLDLGDMSLVVYCTFIILHYYAIVKYAPKELSDLAKDMAVRDIKNPVIIFDHNQKLVDANKSAVNLFNICETDYTVLNYLGFIYDKLNDSAIVDPSYERSMDGVDIVFKNEELYFTVSDKSLYDDRKVFVGRLLVFNNVTELKLSVNELAYISSHDYLTGLKNRHSFRDIAKCLKASEKPAIFVSISIADISLISDVFGSEYTDKIIVMLANAILTEASEDYVCARMNGDEFCILLKNASENDAKQFISAVANRVLEYQDKVNFFSIISGYKIFALLDDDVDDAISSCSDLRGKESYFSSDSNRDSLRNAIESSLIGLGIDTYQRSSQILSLCMKISDELKLTPDEKQCLEMLCSMHDVGLLGVPKEILENIGNLSNDDWYEFKLHTVRGHNIVLSSPALMKISKEILSHHERYDGYGYPYRLKGKDIPLLSRILSLVEFYVDKKNEPHIIRTIEKSRNTMFDSEIVDIFLKVTEI